MSTATKSDPSKWKRVVASVKASSKGGDPGEWSARKAQLATAKYKSIGGGYKGPKLASNSLSKWSKEDWGTKSGKPSGKTGERYLPKAARESLSSKEYSATTRAKREGTRAGKQYVPQPKKIAAKTAHYR